MTKIILFFFLGITVLANAQRRAVRILSIIPEPVSLTRNASEDFVLPAKLTIMMSPNAELKQIARRFSEQLSVITKTAPGFAIPIVFTVKEGNIAPAKSIFLQLSNDATIPKEGYRLEVKPGGVNIRASTPAGIFYGIQTFYQLLPVAVAYDQKTIRIEGVKIEDYPRFGWRGLMLDVTRHFFTVAQVKQYIDDMVKYKFNILHLHLSDDQGWRVEIKSLPKLTRVGAWRVERTGTFGTFSKPEPNEPATYGGFYTHEDIKDLVKYARDRFVNILPEIDMPGHSLAALASYPELSCTPGNYYVSPGDRFMVWPGGGQHFYGLLDNTLCPANEKVYEYMDKVLTEIAELFPFEYIHMGGDETARNFWEKTDAIKTLMQKENLKDLDEVQSYFVKRIEKIIRSKGKKMIGWDEILEGGGLPGNSAVMSWRGMKGGIEAAKQGHEVVMSPTDYAYLDYMQGDAIIEPPVYATLRLKKAYQFEPVPDGVDASLIKGGQANLWSEQVYNIRHAQYMTWPRALAIAESLWSPKEKKDWNNFSGKVQSHFRRFDDAGIKYAPSIYDPIFEVSRKDSTVIVKLSTEIEGLDIHYSFDNSFPDQFYPKYSTPLTVPKDASFMKVITYINNRPAGRMMVMPVSELRKRAK